MFRIKVSFYSTPVIVIVILQKWKCFLLQWISIIHASKHVTSQYNMNDLSNTDTRWLSLFAKFATLFANNYKNSVRQLAVASWRICLSIAETHINTCVHPCICWTYLPKWSLLFTADDDIFYELIFQFQWFWQWIRRSKLEQYFVSPHSSELDVIIECWIRHRRAEALMHQFVFLSMQFSRS